ncbi:YeeE/YedE thiosulfate transporter family protein [uncultured Clostridium sp.]|uniref:YeeE/YedE thiosulfate transporter family protein n=1 Tax=uncultured Clostridium sp. TaxID=59620 RepID=UPI002590A711|nr:YeeE/YedE thiosulfate transporter family protein [uncultured Clostridium sp.]
MKNKKWLLGALILGFSFFISVFLIKPIGVSTQFSVLSGIIHSSIDKDVIKEDPTRESGYISSNKYYDKSEGKLAKSIKNPINYDFIFVLAIPLGGYLGYTLLKKKNLIQTSEFEDEEFQSCPVEENKSTSTCSTGEKCFVKKYGPSFLGGAILLFGARLADGCTSGHMMSGMMQGSVSGYIFAISVFATAIPTAIILNKIRTNKRRA